MKYCTEETFRELVSRVKECFGDRFTLAEIERRARAVLAEQEIIIGIPPAEYICRAQIKSAEGAIILCPRKLGLIK